MIVKASTYVRDPGKSKVFRDLVRSQATEDSYAVLQSVPAILAHPINTTVQRIRTQVGDTCHGCGLSCLEEMARDGILVCTHCGLVAKHNIVDTGAEWRNFEDGPDHSRVSLQSFYQLFQKTDNKLPIVVRDVQSSQKAAAHVAAKGRARAQPDSFFEDRPFWRIILSDIARSIGTFDVFPDESLATHKSFTLQIPTVPNKPCLGDYGLDLDDSGRINKIASCAIHLARLKPGDVISSVAYDGRSVARVPSDRLRDWFRVVLSVKFATKHISFVFDNCLEEHRVLAGKLLLQRLGRAFGPSKAGAMIRKLKKGWLVERDDDDTLWDQLDHFELFTSMTSGAPAILVNNDGSERSLMRAYKTQMARVEWKYLTPKEHLSALFKHARLIDTRVTVTVGRADTENSLIDFKRFGPVLVWIDRIRCLCEKRDSGELVSPQELQSTLDDADQAASSQSRVLKSTVDRKVASFTRIVQKAIHRSGINIPGVMDPLNFSSMEEIYKLCVVFSSTPGCYSNENMMLACFIETFCPHLFPAVPKNETVYMASVYSVVTDAIDRYVYKDYEKSVMIAAYLMVINRQIFIRKTYIDHVWSCVGQSKFRCFRQLCICCLMAVQLDDIFRANHAKRSIELCSTPSQANQIFQQLLRDRKDIHDIPNKVDRVLQQGFYVSAHNSGEVIRLLRSYWSRVEAECGGGSPRTTPRLKRSLSSVVLTGAKIRKIAPKVQQRCYSAPAASIGADRSKCMTSLLLNIVENQPKLGGTENTFFFVDKDVVRDAGPSTQADSNSTTNACVPLAPVATGIVLQKNCNHMILTIQDDSHPVRSDMYISYACSESWWFPQVVDDCPARKRVCQILSDHLEGSLLSTEPDVPSITLQRLIFVVQNPGWKRLKARMKHQLDVHLLGPLWTSRFQLDKQQSVLNILLQRGLAVKCTALADRQVRVTVVYKSVDGRDQSAMFTCNLVRPDFHRNLLTFAGDVGSLSTLRVRLCPRHHDVFEETDDVLIFDPLSDIQVVRIFGTSGIVVKRYRFCQNQQNFDLAQAISRGMVASAFNKEHEIQKVNISETEIKLVVFENITWKICPPTLKLFWLPEEEYESMDSLLDMDRKTTSPCRHHVDICKVIGDVDVHAPLSVPVATKHKAISHDDVETAFQTCRGRLAKALRQFLPQSALTSERQISELSSFEDVLLECRRGKNESILELTDELVNYNSVSHEEFFENIQSVVRAIDYNALLSAYKFQSVVENLHESLKKCKNQAFFGNDVPSTDESASADAPCSKLWERFANKAQVFVVLNALDALLLAIETWLRKAYRRKTGWAHQHIFPRHIIDRLMATARQCRLCTKLLGRCDTLVSYIKTVYACLDSPRDSTCRKEYAGETICFDREIVVQGEPYLTARIVTVGDATEPCVLDFGGVQSQAFLFSTVHPPDSIVLQTHSVEMVSDDKCRLCMTFERSEKNIDAWVFAERASRSSGIGLSYQGHLIGRVERTYAVHNPTFGRCADVCLERSRGVRLASVLTHGSCLGLVYETPTFLRDREWWCLSPWRVLDRSSCGTQLYVARFGTNRCTWVPTKEVCAIKTAIFSFLSDLCESNLPSGRIDFRSVFRSHSQTINMLAKRRMNI